MKTLSTLTVLFSFVVGANAAQAAEHPERLLWLTKLIDRTPTKVQLVEAGSGAHGEALLAIAQDKALTRYPRTRAAAMLAHFDSPQGRLHLGRILDDATIQDREVKIQALAALVHLDGARAFGRLERLSVHADPELRAAALRNLGRIDDPRVGRLLQARLRDGAEPVAWVRDVARRLAARR